MGSSGRKHSQRTKEGLERARASGVRLGRPRVLDSYTYRTIAILKDLGSPPQEIAEVLNISLASVYRALKELRKCG